ncbi:hypothetical protein Tco_0756718 [Tanacetum coccineum]
MTAFETRVRQDTDEIYTRLDDEQSQRQHWLAWRRSMDASDLTRGEVMSLRTTVLGQMSEIRELYAADRRRQVVTSEMLKADHRRSIEMRELRTADRTGDSTTGTGDRTTGTSGTRWRSCTARAARGGCDEENGTKTSHKHVKQNGDDSHTSGTGGRRTERVARECTYQDFMNHDVAYAMTWADLRKKMTDKYCPRNEMKKLEAELWNLKVKGTDVIGLPDMIHGNIVASKPKPSKGC